MGLSDSRAIILDEQLAIFLYACVTGLSLRHLGERFQHSNDTISKYFRRMLNAFSLHPSYTHCVRSQRPTDPTPPELAENRKFFLYFSDAVCAIDGTYINCAPSALNRENARDRKCGISQNCLMACSFDLHFVDVLSEWEGSVADATVFSRARRPDLLVPPGKFYLADAGFASCDELPMPYRDVRYHLSEWERAGSRPKNKQELFNLRHASARNVVERISGILKQRFRILTLPSEYDMCVQARIPPALCAIHNFIGRDDLVDFTEFDQEPPNFDTRAFTWLGELTTEAPTQASRERTNKRRDKIASRMWEDYVAHERD